MMIRSMKPLLAMAALIATGACSKPDGSAASSAGSRAAPSNGSPSQASFESGGAGACDKYLPNDVFKKIVGADADERKALSGQACTVTSTKTGGSLTITLKSITAESFHAFRDYLSDAQPLPGVGDSALSSIAPTVTAIKGSMGCDFDASKGSSPAALGGMDRAKALGEICNKIFAGTP